MITNPEPASFSPSSLTPTATTTNPPQPTPSASASIYASLHTYPFSTDTAFLSGLSQIFGHPGVPVTEAELVQKPDLALSAKCFYFGRKFATPTTPVSAAGYRAWLAASATEASTGGDTIQTQTQTQTQLESQPQPQPQPQPPSVAEPDSVPTDKTAPSASTSSATATTTTTPTAPNPSTSNPEPTLQSQSQPPPPPYPTSFAAIVELITNNQPIPGIEEIPTTVLELGSSKQDRTTRRRKPWEKNPDEGLPDAGIELEGNSEVEGKQGEGSRGKGEGLLRLLRPDAVPDSGLVARE